MPEPTRSELLGKIEILENRIEELVLQNESLRAGIDHSMLFTESKSTTRTSSGYIATFISAAAFKVVAALLRALYRRIYRLKKSKPRG